MYLIADKGSTLRSVRPRLISILGDYGQALLAPELISEIVPLLENPKCRVIGHNLLFYMGVIRAAAGRRLVLSNLWDVMLGWQILNNGLPKSDSSLQAISRDMLGRQLEEIPRSQDGAGEPSEREIEYAGQACMALEKIYFRQRRLIEQQGLEKVSKVEFSSLPAFVEIEHHGIGFNSKRGVLILGRLKKEEDRLEEELKAYARSRGDANFNPRNPGDVKRVLKKMGYPIESTSAAALERVLTTDPKSRFINLLLRYRQTRQQIGFLSSWISSVKGDRIYPRIEQLGGRSGRITCTCPNIHQVPRDPFLRSLFVASPGMSLVEADYSAIEMRLLAVLSGEKVMLDIFKRGLDPHRKTAEAIFQKKDITDEQRQVAKTLNYGTIYGGGANMVRSKLSNLSEAQARDFLDRFYRAYPGLRRWQWEVSEGAPVEVIDGVSYKISRSAWGRIRYVDPGHRNALINTPIQATGADLQKTALGRLYERLAEPRYEEFRLINAVHDSILLEVPKKRTDEASRLLQEVMEKAGDEMLKVIPCLTEVKVGPDWSFSGSGKVSGWLGLMGRAASAVRRIF